MLKLILNSIYPELHKGDFAIIKYVNNIMPEDIEDYNYKIFYVALSCGAIRKIKKISYYNNNSFEDQKNDYFFSSSFR